MGIEVREVRREELEHYAHLGSAAFNSPPRTAGELAQIPTEGRFVAVDGGRVIGTLRTWPFAQFFGGRSIPSYGVGYVSVAPEARGRGVSGAILREVTQEMRRRGFALSALWPSTTAPYRRGGYEVAGSRVLYSIPLASLESRPDLAVEPFGDDAMDEVRAFQREQAALAGNGLIDRSDDVWKHLVLSSEESEVVHRYLVRRGGRITGYLVAFFSREKGHLPPFYSAQEGGIQFGISCRDLVWTDEESARALLGVAAAHRATGTNLYWAGPINDPLQFLLKGPEATVQAAYHWMERLVEVEAALAGRGYPDGMSESFEMSVVDRLVDENSGAYRVEISAGRATVSRIRRAEATVDVGTLAAMFTGWLRPVDAARLGRLDNASASVVAILERAFSGAPPWMSEHF